MYRGTEIEYIRHNMECMANKMHVISGHYYMEYNRTCVQPAEWVADPELERSRDGAGLFAPDVL